MTTNKLATDMPKFDEVFGIAFYIYFFDTEQHHRPHVHVKHGDREAVYDIETATVLEGRLKGSSRRHAERYIQDNKAALHAAWDKAVKGEHFN